MATYIYACQVNYCCLKKPLIPKFKDLRASVSSTFKPFLSNLENLDVQKVIKEISFKLLDNFVDFTFEFVDQPLLPSQSNFAPVEEIGEAVRVTTIQGKIPNDFPEGVYIRNGANPLFGGLKSTKSIFGKSSHIWVEGEGMLHALYFTKEKEKGNKWNIFYKNKYVETDTFNIEKDRKKPSIVPNMEGDALAVFMAILLNVVCHELYYTSFIQFFVFIRYFVSILQFQLILYSYRARLIRKESSYEVGYEVLLCLSLLLLGHKKIRIA
ncbi:9-cis-epoxycarotenoid dioxygenase NCED1, chloroplastic-like [Solanum lycopersicum]|uniref:9-cis-epoxycarotenoid dioxygenase NCED1, chloroplastic-like n=1 Tax=Solanum lycopersicum TaxID=4081 RepID=UPI003748C00A